MSQLFTVMLIGRQAFLIPMATEARHLQSVSHDIHRLANLPGWKSQLFLENHVPWVLSGRPPGQRCAVRFEKARRMRGLSRTSGERKGRMASWAQCNKYSWATYRPGTRMGMAGRCKRHHSPCLKECSTLAWSPNLPMWLSSIMMQSRPEAASQPWPSPSSWS